MPFDDFYELDAFIPAESDFWELPEAARNAHPVATYVNQVAAFRGALSLHATLVHLGGDDLELERARARVFAAARALQTSLDAIGSMVPQTGLLADIVSTGKARMTHMMTRMSDRNRPVVAAHHGRDPQ
jgi:hypothetical protein